MQNSKGQQSKAALNPSRSIGPIALDYVIGAVAKQEGKDQIELASKDCGNYESRRSIR
jgi:glycerol uptake facilitator-like aquaporin